jgi:uncharacterized protein YcbX
MNPHLARIRIFPIKSLDGQDLHEAVLLRSGGLAHDREYCLLDEKGDCANTKRLGEATIHIRSEVDFGFGEITLRDSGGAETFHFGRDQERIESWITERLDLPVRLEHDPQHGFPDDTDAPGPTLVSTESLRTVASWFPGLELDEVRRRFRANLEIDGVSAFWEDRLYAAEGDNVSFQIGDVTLEGVNPCARCTVPSRDSQSGEVSEPDFARIFAEKRRETLPAWAETSRFDHFYRFAVNTRVSDSEAGKVLQVGDGVSLDWSH